MRVRKSASRRPPPHARPKLVPKRSQIVRLAEDSGAPPRPGRGEGAGGPRGGRGDAAGRPSYRRRVRVLHDCAKLVMKCIYHAKHTYRAKMQPLRSKWCTKCNPFTRNCKARYEVHISCQAYLSCKNATPSLKMVYKMQPLHQKLQSSL